MRQVFLTAALCMLCSAFSLGAQTLAAQTLGAEPANHRPASLADYRAAVAWRGAHCIMNAREIDHYGDTVSLASLASETGVPLADITAIAQARGAEHAIAVGVLYAGGKPLKDPPEPFLSLLRQTQSDCQDFERARRQLDRAVARGVLPDTAPPRGPAVLRPALDPSRAAAERATRMHHILRAVDDIRTAGTFEAELLTVAQLISGRPTLTLDDISGINDPQDRRWIAAELMLPNPDTITDLTQAEATELVNRLTAAPDGRYLRYYLSIIAANLDRLDPDILGGTGSNLVLIERSAPQITCQRIAASAALRCNGDLKP